ncbi:ChaN family lipoprotein [Sulfitobacter albidus]|uniref:ChaN family lipoprotein n=1 Tax=Sulfitobacter albidus TaxID=2829501 RepID=A0A975JE64_9RHOB|nr:ChaN family lipoprotein [Sulfitobacter albidus]QUJ76601.1 ChaN family lipoprotein [Sulfitobacter albidus]
MKTGSGFLRFGAVLGAALFFAQTLLAEVPATARAADIVFLGEQHDNPDHHARQAEWVAALAPRALVFEMLTPRQAQRGAREDRADARALEGALEWESSGWPDFAMYHPIFRAAPDAALYGAGVPRAQVRRALERPLAENPLSARYGLDRPAPQAEQAQREAGQDAAHCGMLPAEMLPVMVDAQRLRDMTLADAALRALDETGGPVVVITGNGHARLDWGAPALVVRAAPEVSVFSLLQGEAGGTPPGGGSLTLDAPAPASGDPCAAFRD